MSIGNRIAPVRFLLFLAVLVAGFFAYHAAVPGSNWLESAALAFDAAALVFLISLIPLLRDSDAAAMRRHAGENDANRVLMLAMTTLLTGIAMAAMIGELGGARQGDASAIAKLVGTLVLIWLFANSVYALHYAHAFYTQTESGDARGLDFPGCDDPYYGDFAYFSFTLAMTFQTSDVGITSRHIRRLALFHSFVAFIFNIGVIAFTISVLSGSG